MKKNILKLTVIFGVIFAVLILFSIVSYSPEYMYRIAYSGSNLPVVPD